MTVLLIWSLVDTQPPRLITSDKRVIDLSETDPAIWASYISEENKRRVLAAVRRWETAIMAERFMDKVMETTNVSERFQERDLRAKVASDSDSLVEASERLGHADTAITQRVYRRKPVRIQPLKKGRVT